MTPHGHARVGLNGPTRTPATATLHAVADIPGARVFVWAWGPAPMSPDTRAHLLARLAAFTAASLQHPPAELARLLAAWLAHEHELNAAEAKVTPR